MEYCGLVSPHRSVGGDQVTLTAPRVVSGSNEIMRGAPTAARYISDSFVMSCHVMTCSQQLVCANAILGIKNLSK